MRFLGNKVLTTLFAFTMIMSFNDCKAEWGPCAFEPPCDNNFQPYYPTGDFNVGGSCCPPCPLPCGTPCESPCGNPCGMPYGSSPCGNSCAMPCGSPPCGNPCALPCTPCAAPCAAPCPAPCALPCAPPCASPCHVPCPCPNTYSSSTYNNYNFYNNNNYDCCSDCCTNAYDYGDFGHWGWSNCGRGSGPLCPCHFSFTLRGGVAPAVITQRQKGKIRNFVGIAEATASAACVDGTTIVGVTANETLTVQTAEKRAPDFFKQFNVPWTAGGEISYAVTCNTEIFVDGNYLSADGRRNHYTVEFPEIVSTHVPNPVVVLPAETIKIKEKFSDLRSYDGYIGARYYTNRCCGASLFLGAKLGFRHWDEVRVKTRAHTTIAGVTEPITVDFGKHHYYHESWVVSGGIQAGLNFCITPCLSIVFMAEAVASGTFRFGESQVATNFSRTPGTGTGSGEGSAVAQATATQTILEVPVRRFGTIFVFPVTLGIRYTF